MGDVCARREAPLLYPQGYDHCVCAEVVHGCHEHEARGVLYAHFGAGNGYFVVLKGLAHDFQDRALVLGQLIQMERLAPFCKCREYQRYTHNKKAHI